MDKETETVNVEVQVTPGQLLKEKRESLGLSIEQVADRLRLRATIVESLEADNYDIDKVATFTRGYVRSYARLVGVDEKLILCSFDQHAGLHKPETVAMKSFSRKKSKEQHNSRINLLTFCIIVVVIGISSVWWYQNKQQDSLSPDTSDTAITTTDSAPESEFESVEPDSDMIVNEDTEAQKKIEAEVAPEDLSDAEQITEMTNSSITEQPSADQTIDLVTDTESVVADAPEQAPDAAEETQLSALSQLSMKFEKDCWIRIQDAAGNTLAVGLKKAGHSLSLEGETPISVVLGAPEGVSITLAGEPVDLSRYNSGKVARFTLP